LNEDGTERTCSKSKYVNKAVEEGANIKIVSFDEFVGMLGLTEQQLDELPMVSFDCLYREDAIIKDPKAKRHFSRKNTINEPVIVPNESKTTLGDLFGDLFAKLKEDLEN
jgi:hypothetical protein